MLYLYVVGYLLEFEHWSIVSLDGLSFNALAFISSHVDHIRHVTNLAISDC